MANELLSPFINIFNAIRQHIADATAGGLYIDQDLGQLRNTTRPPVAWPCLLVDFEDFKFENLGNNVQTAKGTVVLQLAFAPYSNSGTGTPPDYASRAIAYYEMEAMLNGLLQGWQPTTITGSMIRTSVMTQKRSDHYRVRELRYSLAFEDYSAKPHQTWTDNWTLHLADVLLH